MESGWAGKAFVVIVLLTQILIGGACDAHMSSQTFRRIETGFFGGTGQRDGHCEVFRDEGRFEEFYRGLHGNRIPAPVVPEVDFDRDVILFFSLGVRPTSGYSVDVAQVLRKGDELEVRLLITEPARDSLHATVVTEPFVMISVEKYSGVQKVRFVGPESECMCEEAF
ncbi:MAG: protease complex subunit PrcB family protein [Proteobacteria bacterium]|nr:protease complex subunit PrcB family protein [Pseudomonadota bacterium]